MGVSTGQVAVQKRRTARSRRFLIRFGLLCAGSAAAFLAGTAAAQADEQYADPEVVQDESAAVAQLPDDAPPPPEGMPPADVAEPGIEVAGLPGTVAVVTEIVAETTELIEEVPAAGVPAPVVEAVAHTVRGVAATGGTVLDGAQPGGSDLVADALDVVSQAVAPEDHPEDDAGTDVPAPQVQTPAPQAPGHHGSGETFVLPAVDEFEKDRQLAAPLPSEMSRPAAALLLAVDSEAADLRSASDSVAPVEVPAETSSDFSGGAALSELLGGDHGVVSGAGGTGVADRATPGSTLYGDRAGLVSDPVRTDARPHTAPVARPGFAPD